MKGLLPGVKHACKERLYMLQRHKQNANRRRAVSSYFIGANGVSGNMSNADLRDIDLSGADLSKVFLVNTDLRKSILNAVNLAGADLSGAHLHLAQLVNANLRGAILRRSDFQGACLRAADLRDADLRRATLQGVDLRHADCRGADFRGADCRGADLRGTDLRECLSHSTRQGISKWLKIALPHVRLIVSWDHVRLFELPAITLSMGNFEGAIYDMNTRWPDDFDRAKLDAMALFT
jgi:hypothetical protein